MTHLSLPAAAVLRQREAGLFAAVRSAAEGAIQRMTRAQSADSVVARRMGMAIAWQLLLASVVSGVSAPRIKSSFASKRAAGTRWRRLLPSLEYAPLLDAGRVLHHLDYEQVPAGEAGEDGGGGDSGCVSM